MYISHGGDPVYVIDIRRLRAMDFLNESRKEKLKKDLWSLAA